MSSMPHSSAAVRRSLSRSLGAARNRERGYTVVEVLAAMTLFAIGAAGVISMQRVTIQGGTDARRFDVGANIANEWVFRLQRDSMFWTLPDSADPITSNRAATRWLNTVSPMGTPPTWITPAIPTTAEGGISPAFDVFGRDLPAAAGVAEGLMYCTQIRLQWIADPGASMQMGALIRGEVRVFWPRLESKELTTCAGVSPDAAPNDYHIVYVATVIRQNPNR
jgi:prepilin-type N-terminal cleavage/methylation domain-containing protein